ncbi:MAG: monovalent cation/H(+) antiporter subunit G [Rhodanobacteraceae bacterium]
MNIAVDALLAFAVLIAWIIALAFLRLRSGYDRLHAITFFNLVGGGAITAAVAITDGFTARTFQCVLIWLVVASAGALLSHAVARALRMRGEMQE